MRRRRIGHPCRRASRFVGRCNETAAMLTDSSCSHGASWQTEFGFSVLFYNRCACCFSGSRKPCHKIAGSKPNRTWALPGRRGCKMRRMPHASERAGRTGSACLARGLANLDHDSEADPQLGGRRSRARGFPGPTEEQGDRVLEKGTGPEGETLRPAMHISSHGGCAGLHPEDFAATLDV